MNEKQYCFFVQPQITTETNKTIGYELLLRKRVDGAWRLPDDFHELTIAEQFELVEETISELNHPMNEALYISVNIDAEQATDPLTLEKALILSEHIQPVNLVVELTEAVPLEIVKYLSLRLHQENIMLAIDDVGTGSNCVETVVSNLPFVDELKFAMQNFRADDTATEIDECLSFWKRMADENQVYFVLEGVEDQHDQDKARDYGVDFQQGYFYGKPVKV